MKGNKKRNVTLLIVAGVLILLIVAVVIATAGSRDHRRAEKLLDQAQKAQKELAEYVENPDRDTFLTVDQKVVVGYLQIPSLDRKYAVLNTFDENTAEYSLCRDGSKMPWDVEGMTVYGIASFTGELEGLTEGEELIFEDLAGETYSYQYVMEDKEKVIDHGIQIISSDKKKNEKEIYQFVKKAN